MGDFGVEARDLIGKLGQRTFMDESYTGACVTKWDRLLKGIPVDYDFGRTKQNTAMLMENTMQYIKNSNLNEDTLSTNSGSYIKYVFPILQRVIPNLIANQLVSVQPMNAPTGGVAYYEKKYDDRKGSTIPQGGISNLPTAMNYDGELAAGDNMIQNFSKYYSSEFVDYDSVCTDTGTTTTGALTQASTNCRVPKWKPIRSPGTSGQRTFYIKAYYRMLDADNASADTAVVATLNSSGSFIDNTANTNTVGTLNITTGNWSISATGSAGTNSQFTNNTVIYFQYFVNWELVGYTTGADIPSVSLDIAISEIRAQTRNLKAKWTLEAMDDLRAMYGVDAEAEMINIFSNEIVLELDREIITDLVNGAAHAATYTYAQTIPGEIEQIRLLLTQIGAVSAAIHRTTGRAPANFLVVSTQVGSLLDQLSTHGDYASIEQNIQSPSYGPVMSNFGIARVGTLLKKYAVYQDPYMTSNQILVGLKGNSFVDAGYVYAPYVPLSLTPTFVDPNTNTVVKGARTRYATKMLRPEYYGVITCTGLPTVTTTL